MNAWTRTQILVAAAVCLLLSGRTTWAEECTIAGRVVDYLARPVADAEAVIYERVYDYSIGHYSGVLADEIRKTDRDGHFVLTADMTLSDINVYMLVVRKDGYALGWERLSRVEDVVVVLERPCEIRGILVDAEGQPVADAQVRAAPRSSYLRRLDQTPVLAPEPWLTTRTDDQGAFAFEDFSADVSTDFWVAAPQLAQVYQFTTNMMSVCGFETGRTDIHLVLPREVPLRGIVVDHDSGDPVAGASVSLHPKGIEHDTYPFIPTVTTSGPHGRFAFDGVSPGLRYVNVSAPLKTGLVDRRVTFNVTTEDIPKEVTVELRTGGKIELAAAEQETGEPIEGLSVYFWQAVQNDQSDFYKDMRTDANGAFCINAPVGECGFSTRSDRYSPMFHEDQVLVSPGQTAQPEVVLDRYVHVSGLVVDEAGGPVAGAVVTGAVHQTDRDGRFEIEFDPGNSPYAWIVRHVRRNLAAVALVEDIGQSPRITLRPAMLISGTVTDPSDRGIPAARVALTLQIPGVLMPCAPEVVTDSNGRFEIRAVAPEQEGFSYRLSVNASEYSDVRFRRISVQDEPDSQVRLEPIVLQPADQSVSGVVVDANGLPAGGLPIYADGDNQPSRHTASDSDGRFVIRRVCQGPMRLQASYDSRPGGAGFLAVEGGDQDVTIILGREGVHQQYASLTGKLLGDGRELGLDLSRGDLEDKRIVLCFFDFQQRPSRNALLQLAREADTLTDHGVALLGVQASAVDSDVLKAWTDQVSVPFPVGAISRDVDVTRLDWGVQSLPWLILTDTEHRVVAEGFSTAEIGDMIE